MDFASLSIVLIVLIIGFGALAWLIRGRAAEQKPDQALLLLQNQLTELRQALDTKLGESTKALREQFGESGQMIHKITKDVTQELGRVGQELVRVAESNKQVMHITDQLKNLQDILKNPKQRGILGEYYLETVLKNVLPPGSFQMQYPFKNGEIVDAAIFYQGKIIPVDSKFSLENYNRMIEAKTDEERKRHEDALRADLKNRIDETSKYIRPGEGTIEFAFMFIPSEALYYDLLINKVGTVSARDLLSYATAEKRVFVVSPTSFLAYLQTVIWGINQVKINESAEHIRKNVSELKRHLETYESYFRKLGGHLNTTYNMYTKAYGEFKKVDKDVYRITGEAMEIEAPTLEPPHIEEEE